MYCKGNLVVLNIYILKIYLNIMTLFFILIQFDSTLYLYLSIKNSLM